MDQAERMKRHQLISKAFRPAAPVDDQSLFAGRVKQMVTLLDLVEQPGQHAAIYGGRGVGKTSLAKVMVKVLAGQTDPIVSLHYTCTATDTFDSIWKSIFGDLFVTLQSPGFGFAPQTSSTAVPSTAIIDLDSQPVSADTIRRGLLALSRETPLAIFIDEFDRLPEQEKFGFADTTKVLSDQLTPATIVLIGVADDIDGLVEAHQSVRRSLGQIFMPNM